MNLSLLFFINKKKIIFFFPHQLFFFPFYLHISNDFVFLFIVIQSQAKFSLERAREALDWVEAVLDRQLNYPQPAEGLRDQLDFAHVLKDGITLCE